MICAAGGLVCAPAYLVCVGACLVCVGACLVWFALRGGPPLHGRVERWRGGLGAAYRFPALSSAGASLAGPCPVSTARSSNRTCTSPASGSPTGFTDQPTDPPDGEPFTGQYSCFRDRRTLNGGARPEGHSPAVGHFDNPPEVRPLSSTGITRRRRYYEPVRLPRRPSLSLTGVRLGHAPTAGGLPCCVRSPAQTCRRHYPGGTGDWDRFAPLTAPTAAFPVHWAGRLPR